MYRAFREVTQRRVCEALSLDLKTVRYFSRRPAGAEAPPHISDSGGAVPPVRLSPNALTAVMGRMDNEPQ